MIAVTLNKDVNLGNLNKDVNLGKLFSIFFFKKF